MKRLLYILVIVITAIGCSTSPPKKVLTSINSYYYYTDRFTDRCPSYDTADCPEFVTQKNTLNTWNKLIKEAKKAIDRGGDLPLQLKALNNIEKKFKKEVKNEW